MQNTATSPVRSLFAKDASTSTIKIPPNAGRMIFSQKNSSSSSDAEVESSISSFVPSSDSDYEEDDFPQDMKDEQLQTLNSTRLLIEENPKKYIPDHWFPHVINLFSTQTNICKDDC
ncbi:hypothetical protein JTB14_018428 [Gonioctena quinquepunctata]|nr:hypothetical protein JTB14_018428 [Gonioctena quinquepunctata]